MKVDTLLLPCESASIFLESQTNLLPRILVVEDDIAIRQLKTERLRHSGYEVDADEDGGGGDDAADALRYLVATKSRAVVQRKLRGLQGFRICEHCSRRVVGRDLPTGAAHLHVELYAIQGHQSPPHRHCIGSPFHQRTKIVLPPMQAKYKYPTHPSVSCMPANVAAKNPKSTTHPCQRHGIQHGLLDPSPYRLNLNHAFSFGSGIVWPKIVYRPRSVHEGVPGKISHRWLQPWGYESWMKNFFQEVLPW